MSMDIQNPSDLQMFLQLGSVAYAFIIFTRSFRVIAARTGFGNNQREFTVIAVVLAVMMFVGGQGIGWAAAIFSLLMMTSIIALYTVVSGGMAAGALLRSGVTGAIVALLLIAATASLGFIEPLLAAPFCTAVLGLSIYLEYRDTYGVLHSTLWRNEVVHYFFVYPPLVLLFTLTDILVVTPALGQTITAVIVTACTLLGMVYGYRYHH